MVVHTPSKLEVLRQTAAERRAAADVPPSVAAAVAAASTQETAPTDHSGDLLGNLQEEAAGGGIEDTAVHDFDAWDGDLPPGTVRAEIHTSGTEGHVNVTTRRGKGRGLTDDADKISVVSDVTPPPQAANYPQLNPFIRPSNSPWASPLHVIPKADGGWRPCGDYRKLNVVTADEPVPAPTYPFIFFCGFWCIRLLSFGPRSRIPPDPNG